MSHIEVLVEYQLFPLEFRTRTLAVLGRTLGDIAPVVTLDDVKVLLLICIFNGGIWGWAAERKWDSDAVVAAIEDSAECEYILKYVRNVTFVADLMADSYPELVEYYIDVKGKSAKSAKYSVMSAVFEDMEHDVLRVMVWRGMQMASLQGS